MKKLSYKALRGTKDIFPPEVFIWQDLEEKARKLFSLYQYKEIRTPIIEELKLFVRSVGETTDIVQKEIFSFKDRGEREICLRPEATASCVRAFLENNLHVSESITKFFYFGPMFRAERPQAGRYRQFYQMGVEVFGSYSYLLDAEIISLLIELVKEFGLTDYLLKINSLGCIKDKENISQKYREILLKKNNQLCPLCKERVKRNVLRVLDCKEIKCQELAKELPSTLDLICEDCHNHFEALIKIISCLGINYIIEPRIVRGIDYYTRTVFELISPLLGSQDALGAGGRYDNLIEDLGGPPMGAVGFALGMERILLVSKKSKEIEFEDKIPEIFIVTLGREADKLGFLILQKLRKKNLFADMDYTEKSLKAKMRRANKIKAKFVVIIGDEEIKKGKCILRNMKSGAQEEIEQDKLLEVLINKLS